MVKFYFKELLSFANFLLCFKSNKITIKLIRFKKCKLFKYYIIASIRFKNISLSYLKFHQIHLNMIPTSKIIFKNYNIKYTVVFKLKLV